MFCHKQKHLSMVFLRPSPFSLNPLMCLWPPDKRDRMAFWDSFENIGSLLEASWMCIRNFNSVLDQSEKLGGKLVFISSNCPFRSFIDVFCMIDIGFAGNPYTSSNNRQGLHTIKERLDRGLASPN